MIYIHVMARMASERAPGKSCASLAGKPSFIHSLERTAKAFDHDGTHLTQCIVNTTTATLDDAIEMLAESYGYTVVRYPEETPTSGLARVDRFCREWNLSPEDLLTWTAGDSPFSYETIIPYLCSRLIEHGCDRFVWSENPTNTLIWGVNWSQITTYRGFRNSFEQYAGMEQFPWFTPLAPERILLVDIPEKLRQPWPWKKTNLDYPLQVAQAKMIYKELYTGEPLSIWDVYELMKSKPELAHMTDSCPGLTLYGQHLDWFWEAYKDHAAARIQIPDELIV